MMVRRDSAFVYDFADNDVPGAEERDRGYWRDVGTIDAYYEAQMDLVAVHPIFNLYNQHWPIYTHHQQFPPAKFVQGGLAQESIVGAGTIVSGATVRQSVLSPNVRVQDGSYVEGSVLMDGVRVGAGCRGSARDPRQERRRPGRCAYRRGRRLGPRPLPHFGRWGRGAGKGPDGRTVMADDPLSPGATRPTSVRPAARPAAGRD